MADRHRQTSGLGGAGGRQIMNNLDLLASVGVGTFLIVAVARGRENTEKMISLAKRDASFIKWAIALAVLIYLRQNKTFGELGNMLIFAAFLGIGLNAGSKISAGISQLWKKLGD